MKDKANTEIADKKKMGRTKTNIDWLLVKDYLNAQCDGTDIAEILGMHPNTLYEACKVQNGISFSEYSALKKSEGKSIMRYEMYKKAFKEGDKTLQIWLSKQYLDMKDQSAVIQTMEGMPEVLILPASTAKPAVYDEADIIDPTEK